MIVAHSFGCRIALWYSYVYGCKKMVLTGAAGIPSLKNKFQKWLEMEYHISKYIYKKLGLLKRIEQLQNSRGSYDYRNASPIMKETLVKVIHNDVTGILSSIYTPTILIVGDKDDITPIWMSKVMEEKMQDVDSISKRLVDISISNEQALNNLMEMSKEVECSTNKTKDVTEKVLN